jgi:uncharacterized protein YjbI with pentapeptide repeats
VAERHDREAWVTQFVAARAAMNHSRSARYTQAQFNQVASAHERLVRGQPFGRRAILRFVQAPGVDFSRRLLTGADLSGACLEGARLAYADFERACLFFADLRAVDARGANFSHADIRGVSLRQANLVDANFDEADLREAVLSRTGAKAGLRLAERPATAAAAEGDVSFSVDFTNCSMKRATLAGAKLEGANFTDALLDGADLKGANLKGARFAGAVLTGVTLDGAAIDPGALAHCLLDPTAAAIRRAAELLDRLEAAELWITSDGAEGRPARLDGEDLRPLGRVFPRRRLTALSADRACAVGVSFAGAQLQGASFDGADLRDADFTGADLRGASMRGAKLRHARFRECDLRPLPLAHGGARAVDLDGADQVDDCFAESRRV